MEIRRKQALYQVLLLLQGAANHQQASISLQRPGNTCTWPAEVRR
jgi:hypothetical protein